MNEQGNRFRRQKQEEIAKDTAVYTCCSVKLPFSEKPYAYRAEDSALQIEDRVIVPVGVDNEETEGVVVSVGQYARIAVPYPVERTKTILRKVTEG
ncbi:MAG: hypothetical protein Q4C60_05075 [Eubacteriales bacterium]|nr:hypothetical protein [Eubacteriales bacterium]